jgi:N,N'-diacetyllegionaminate synthase
LTKVVIIAEAGVNHNGSLDLALQLVDAAVEAEADIVKFQIAIPELVATHHAKKADYQLNNTDTSDSQLEMIQKLVLKDEDFNKISDYCKEKKILFLLSAFDIISFNKLSRWAQPYCKIASGELTNTPFLRRVAKARKPIILSTGMSDIFEIGKAIDELLNYGVNKNDLTILHCNTEYPTPFSDVNLFAMQTIKEKFDIKVGYSDHTLGPEVSIAAVALGAKVIEKHLTLDRGLGGPDHKASMEPKEFKSMVLSIRNIEKSLGTGVKRPSKSEINNINIARRSIVALSPIKKGEIYSDKNIYPKRPGNGISPIHWDKVIGRSAKRDYEKDELIEW